ncbi:MAG: hypothetical protein IJA12_00320 [Oscillospiraceae bacterium]|nr:hypothetical protein [Oscillospiraceae bacterium]
MGLFSKLFSKKTEEEKDLSFIKEIAGLITENDENVMKHVHLCISNPTEYECQYEMRGTEKNDPNFNWLCMIDELEEGGWLFSADYKSEPEDILWGLSQLKSYHLIEKYIPEIDLTKIDDAETLAQEINLAVNDAFVCMIYIDSDSYELIIVTHEVYEKISAIAENNGHSIEIF